MGPYLSECLLFCRILEEIYGRYTRELSQSKQELEKAHQEMQEKKTLKCNQLFSLFKESDL